jgi:hypothetical protein
MTNPFEKGPERILSTAEVMEVIKRFAENAEIQRELSDEHGVYLIEATVPGDAEGEVIEYGYMRKGQFGRNQASETALHKVIYDNGMPIGGDKVSVFNPETGEWIDEPVS